MRSRFAVAGTWLLFIDACTTIRPIEPADLSPPHAPARAWVTYANDSTVVLDSARVNGDTLVGTVGGKPERILLSQATTLRARELSGDRTAGLVWSWTAAMTLLVVHFFTFTSTSPYHGCWDLSCGVR